MAKYHYDIVSLSKGIRQICQPDRITDGLRRTTVVTSKYFLSITLLLDTQGSVKIFSYL